MRDIRGSWLLVNNVEPWDRVPYDNGVCDGHKKRYYYLQHVFLCGKIGGSVEPMLLFRTTSTVTLCRE